MQTEIDLVIELRKGNQEAYKKLHDLLFHSIYYFASNLIHNNFDANDIATKVFIRLWELRSNFHTYENLKAFLYLSTRYASLDYLNEQTRLARRKRKILEQYKDREEDLYRPEFFRLEMVRTEMLESFYKEIKKLPPVTRRILELKLKKNMATAEIAAKLGLAEITIRRRFSAGIRQLRERPELEKKWSEFNIMIRD